MRPGRVGGEGCREELALLRALLTRMSAQLA
ncbi:hypothetical protein BJY14_003928 [Actinomadura luteofluorescens]|uniref:Uncharacterized protein n=1 Tax=Actinomadura luteofluorescens TaxID=46163 RepID=A0A7Y9EIR0_9ACTN|nr:hypothetical protein [Actinomadura luteofluorescens]